MSEWTKEKPTESGIYWARSGLETVICKLWPDGELEFIGTTHTKRLNEAPLDCEWSGPIEPPSDDDTKRDDSSYTHWP